MKLSLLALTLLVGCGSVDGIAATIPDASEEPTPTPLNDYTVEAGICCQLTNNLTMDYPWYNARYSCILEGGLQAFNPPWICGVNDAGMCGADSGVDCLTCDQPICTVGMSCLGANGTGIVLPCDQQDW